jgi:uncharacterized delta-60 repeat protein
MYVRRFLVVATALVAALPAIGGSARAGDVDLRFGKRGVALVDLRGTEYARAVDVAKNGSILVAGYTTRASRGFYDFAIARLKGSGGLDKTFSGDGKTATDFGDSEIAFAVAAAPGGKVVAAGIRTELSGFFNEDCCYSDLVVARYTSKGKLDPAFGDGGKVVVDLQSSAGQDGFVSAVAVQPDGKVIIGATGVVSPTVPTQPDLRESVVSMIIVRLDNTGILDPTFGTGGITALNVDGATNSLADLELQGDGSVVVAGTTDAADSPGYIVARLLTTGTLDPTFGPGGFVRTAFDGGRASAAALAIHAKSGKVVVAGRRTGTRSAVVLARYLPDGSLDAAFSKDGRVVSGSKQEMAANDLAVGPDGKPVVLAGVLSCPPPCTSLGRVVRWTTKGSVDKKFGYKGMIDIPAPLLFAYGLAVQGSKLLVAGMGLSIRQGKYGYFVDVDMGVARIKL